MVFKLIEITKEKTVLLENLLNCNNSIQWKKNSLLNGRSHSFRQMPILFRRHMSFCNYQNKIIYVKPKKKEKDKSKVLQVIFIKQEA